jgi:hypothetical protein
MKFVVMDTYGYFGNIMPRNHFIKDISEIYKTQKIPCKYYGRMKEFFIVEIDDINSLIDFKQIVKKPIIIGKDLKLPEEIENQIDSTILIYDWYIE